MIHIFTSIVNRPDFLEYQLQSLNKFVKDDFTFHAVYDNGIDPNVLEKFKEVCDAGIVLHEADDRVIHSNPSTCISLVVDWIFNELMLKEYKDDICVILDADMFLIDELNIEEYIEDYPILGIPQNREHVYYITNQLMVFNMPKIISIDTDIDFMDGIVEGQSVDSCGKMYYWFKENNVELKKVSTEYPSHYNDINIADEGITAGINFEIYDDIFLHYRAGSNWFHKWKQEKDPLQRKMEIFETIMSDVLSE